VRKVVSLVVLLSLLFKSFCDLGIVGWYVFNQKYIAQNLCENRSQPQRHCNGKCVLLKKLKAVQKADKDHQTENTVEHFSVVFYLIPDTWLSKAPFSFSPKLKYYSFDQKVENAFSQDHFKPPGSVASL